MRYRHRCIINGIIALMIFIVLVLFISQEKLAARTVLTSCLTTSDGLNGRSLDDHNLRHKDVPVVAPGNASMQIKLILLTYMRSGSSFTGDLFNHHPEVFYVYEPLYSIQKNFNFGDPAFFFNRGPSQPNPKRWFEPNSLASSILQAYLNCNFYGLDPRTLSQYHLKNSLSTEEYYNCEKGKPGILGTLQCLPLLFHSCRQARVTAVKTIRFSVAQAAFIMKTDPQVKVIHLIRDPRPTLRSQARVGEFKPRELNEASKDFCARVLNDLRQAKAVKTQYPDRVLRIRYEDLAMEPLRFAEKVLNFADLKLDDPLRKYIWNITSAGFQNNCVICTTRTDSRKTATEWRTKTSFQGVKIIDNNCAELYKEMGYLPVFTPQSMKNLSVPTFLVPSRVPGLWQV